MKLLFISLATILSGTTVNVTDIQDNVHRAQKGFAVVELFTSEGCSSCPPADEAVADIQREFPDNVFVLSFHVDYWNYLGWKDEFSDASYSVRQQRYGSAFHLESIYTPQVVVNGKKEFVGSDKIELEKTIGESLKSTASSDVQLNISAASSAQGATVQYESNANGKYELNIALVQLKAESDVKRGENKGRKLKHINIVRGFKIITMNGGTGSAQFEIPAGLSKQDCKIIAYLQDKNSLEIIGTGQTGIQ